MRTREQIVNFIEINRFCTTTEEMAEELGVSYATVGGILFQNGWKALTKKERKTVDEEKGTAENVPDEETSITQEEIPGLIEIAALIVEDMTDEQKKMFQQKYMTEKARR